MKALGKHKKIMWGASENWNADAKEKQPVKPIENIGKLQCITKQKPLWKCYILDDYNMTFWESQSPGKQLRSAVIRDEEEEEVKQEGFFRIVKLFCVILK